MENQKKSLFRDTNRPTVVLSTPPPPKPERPCPRPLAPGRTHVRVHTYTAQRFWPACTIPEMFTPPASPRPNPLSFPAPPSPSPSPSPRRHLSPPTPEKYIPSPSPASVHAPSQLDLSAHAAREAHKRRQGRRLLTFVLLVPLLLILLTFSARVLSYGPPAWLAQLDLPHRLSNIVAPTPCTAKHGHGGHRAQAAAASGVEAGSAPVGESAGEGGEGEDVPENAYGPDASLVRRQPQTATAFPSGSSTSTSTSSSTSAGTSGIPTTTTTPTSNTDVTIPPVPSVAPVLPTPFPQPFNDGLITKNFSSVSCMNFFTDMAAAKPFRSCRPFSMLLNSSDDFVAAQNNLTLLNTLIWGTCNTATPEAECVGNMASYAGNLQVQCAQDLRDGNAMAVGALTSLTSYALMRTSACLTDPSTSTYCFLTAAASPNPTNLYYYNLPLGLNIPSTNANPDCTACLKTLMGVYGDAMADGAVQRVLGGLRGTYERAAGVTRAKCGEGAARVGLVSGAGGGGLVFPT
ncbi:hypothetical protein D9611_007144 [Ephemerocybe angulata]|uniref:DUF7729 domain-containing protein n=1 Tax=Ephemerocybe angulata TaxID=980116 RepID=A0A8H5B252_9AGAR|nr:hypothetical protein D9611_007144 [Tulosesus angulatus]